VEHEVVENVEEEQFLVKEGAEKGSEKIKQYDEEIFVEFQHNDNLVVVDPRRDCFEQESQSSRLGRL
jgi:hypothetical protein